MKNKPQYLDRVHTRIWYAQAEFELAEATLEVKRTALEDLLQQCNNPECAVCGVLVCPYSDGMHYHHDGCPSCAEREGEPRTEN